MDKRFVGLVGLLALMLLASCEVESITEQDELASISALNRKGTGDDPPED